MSKSEFERLYLGNFESHEDVINLDDTMDNCYRCAKHMSGNDDYIMWKDVYLHFQSLGFNRDTFNEARRRAIERNSNNNGEM